MTKDETIKAAQLHFRELKLAALRLKRMEIELFVVEDHSKTTSEHLVANFSQLKMEQKL